MQVPERLKSRKLWALLVGLVVNVFNDALGLGLDQGTLGDLNLLIVGYLGAQGVVDATKAINTVTHDEI